jgi:hypothetical protein
MTTPGIRSAREMAHAIEICNVAKWQCSGCRGVFFGRLLNVCPSCAREGYWTGSVDPDALKSAGGVPHSTVCDRLTAAITADRSTLEAALTAREGELREAVSLLAETFAMLNRTIEGRLGYIPGAWTLHPTVAAYLASHPRRDTP